MNAAEKWMTHLSRLLGSQGVVTDPLAIDEHAWDALSQSRIHPRKKPEFQAPRCLVLPASAAEVCEVVLWANLEKIPVVVYGGGSGLMGGAISVRPGVVMDLQRMSTVRSIDTDGQQARVEAGCVLEALDRALGEAGLMLGHDPWTYPVATVGGAISTNGLGYRGGKYGCMGQQVLGLEAVLPQGEILRTRGVVKSSTGIDLNRLLIGGEGCFGIVTEATLKVFSLPEKRAFLAYRFASFETGFEAVVKLSNAGLKPSLLDFGDNPGKFSDGAMLYLAFEGREELVRVEQKLARAICKSGGGRGRPGCEAEKLWNDRHVIARRFMVNRRQRRQARRDGTRWEFIHVALPASRVLAYRKAAMDVIAKRGVRLQESGLWTGPGLFSMRLAQEGTQDPVVLEDLIEELLRLAQAHGGSMEYCHGVGFKLAPLMAEELGQGLDVMARIKRTLDPNGIMNPGKLGL